MKEIVLDTETTGISVKEGHRIVEIACLELENLIPTGNKFHCCLNPERKVSEKAFQVHGYSDEFLEFIKDKTLIIHNAEFDIAHLNNELSLCEDKKISNKIVDTLVVARDKFPGSQVSLDALCKRYRIDNSERIKHNALLDCALLAKVYINLIDQKEPTLNFQNHIYEVSSVKNKSVSYYKKIVVPNDDELIEHEQYLKNFLKKNNF